MQLHYLSYALEGSVLNQCEKRKMKDDQKEKILNLWCCSVPEDMEDLDAAICQATKILAATMFELLPECPERTLAVRRLQESKYWARQSLCCDQAC